MANACTCYTTPPGGERLAFVADFSAVAASLSAPPISGDGVENWLYRNPPAQYGGIAFERFLALVLERRDNSAPAAKIYSVAVPVDAATMEFLEAEAAESGLPPESFLRTTLLVQLEDELEIWQASRKRKRGRIAL